MRLSLLAAAMLVFTSTSNAESPIGFFGPNFGKPVPAETVKNYPMTMDHLEGEGLRAIQFDLNGDGKLEFIRVYGPSSCGTGGCPFEVFDGASKRTLGELFGGTVWVFSRKINGWPVLTVYSHGSAASGSYATLVYDGKNYVQVSSVYLYEQSVKELFEKYKTVPRIE